MLFRSGELADKAYNNGQYLFTGFLSAAELDIYYHMERELSYVPVTVSGGTADCERVMLRFGSEELCGYEEVFPIQCIEIICILLLDLVWLSLPAWECGLKSQYRTVVDHNFSHSLRGSVD